MKRSTAAETPPLFVDTWGWLALEDAAEAAHSEVRSLRQKYADQAAPWVTTDYVLDETITRLFARRPFAEAERFCRGIFRAQSLGLLAVERVTPTRFEKAFKLRLRYRDKPRISFTDLTSFVVMDELKLLHALTQDAHFRQCHFGFQTLP